MAAHGENSVALDSSQRRGNERSSYLARQADAFDVGTISLSHLVAGRLWMVDTVGVKEADAR